MRTKLSKVKKFLIGMDMYHENLDMEKAYQHFLDEMENGLKGENSSLHMLPTFIESTNEIPVNKKVIVLDAGGTNFRAALVHFDTERKVVIDRFKKCPMPGSKGILSLDQFFDQIADAIEDVVDKSDKIGFCFSYPTEVLPNKDGRLIKFCKEIEAPEVVGELIGKNLLERIKSRGIKKDHKIVILNDTVATLLTGKTSAPGRNYDDFAGFILGTGLNSCYSEANEKILKLDKNLQDGNHKQIINIESGGFEVNERGDIDKILDSKTKEPGSYFLEKMTSGAYFGALITELIARAEGENLISSEFCEYVLNHGQLTTIEVNGFLHNPYSKDNILSNICSKNSEEDREILFYLIDAMMERAAKLIAINMAAIILKSGKGKSPVRPICLTVDGTTFYAYHKFHFRVEQYLSNFLCGIRKRYYDIILVDDAPLIGAAIAALTNL